MSGTSLRRARIARYPLHLAASLALALANGSIELTRRVLFPRRRPRNARRVLVHRVGRIGDGVCALPALAAVRAAHPGAHVTLLTSTGSPPGPGLVELVEGSDVVDEVLAYTPEDVRGLREARAFLRTLRGHRPDVWVALPQHLSSPRTELRNALFARLAGARWAGGFGVSSVRWLGRGLGRRLTAARALHDGPARDEASALLLRLAALGIEPGPRPELPVPSPHAAEAELDRAGGPWLAVAPFANRAANRWSLEAFAELARRWRANGGRVCLLGGPRDRSAGRRLADALPGSLDLVGRTDLRQASAVLRRAEVLLGADTGLVHLAAAAGTRCVVVTASRDVPGRWAPHGAGHHVVRHELACSPCWRDACPVGGACLAAIEREEVWNALARHLPAGPGAPGRPDLEAPAPALPHPAPETPGRVQAPPTFGR